MTGCVFCSILDGREAASFIYRDERAAVFLDRFPVNRGHALVVPSFHFSDVAGCPPELAAHLFAVARLVAPAIVAATGAEGFNVWTASGRAAGQQVMHLHLHVLPRWRKDSFGLRFPKDYPREEMRAELDRLARTINRGLSPEGRSSYLA